MRPNWDEYFMSFAILASSRSSCNHVRSGSVIVLDNRIIGTGYNGTPTGIENNCLEVNCRKENMGEAYADSLNTGKCVGVHSEMNALANLSREIHKGATLYTTIFPCPSCAKNLLAYNIRRIVYKREYDKDETKLSLKILESAGVQVEKLDMHPDKIKSIIFEHKKNSFDVFSQDELLD